MKRLLLLAALLLATLNLFGSVRPFNTKIVKDTEFTLCQDANVAETGFKPAYVFYIKKGVTVTVIGRSAVDPGRLHIKLGDGSRGWVPAEAFCDKTEITVKTGKGTKTYHLGKDACKKYFSEARKERSDEYSLLCQTILNEYLPEAYRHLAVHAGHGSSLCELKGGFDSLYGCFESVIEEVLGDGEGVVGPAFKEKNGRFLFYYADVYTGKAGSSSVYTGLYVVYDKDYRAVNVIAPQDFKRSKKGLKITPMISPKPHTEEGIQRGIQPEYPSMVFSNLSIKDESWEPGPPKVLTDTDRKEYTVIDDAYGTEETPWDREEQRSKEEEYKRTHAPVTPSFTTNRNGHDTFKWALIRILFYFAVLVIVELLFEKGVVRNYNAFWWGYLLVSIAAFPFPLDFFSHFFHWGLWGGCEIVIGLFLAYCLWDLVSGLANNRNWVRCPGCHKWVVVRDRFNYHLVNYSNDKPKKDPMFQPVLVRTSDPRDYEKKDVSGQGAAYRDTDKLYYYASRMLIHATQVSTCRCPNCSAKWKDRTLWTGEVRGPIIQEERTERIKSYIEKTLERDPRDGKMVEKQRVEKEERDNFMKTAHIDYKNYEPYFKRYAAGDDDAPGEYYIKYWPKE